ncbi:MAG TPA: molybdopterin-dependent oxidoreductase, partial [Opitutales bacterium]|nr:molybdopterin-dependent oxidoreductase [Opitutales bacterium]
DILGFVDRGSYSTLTCYPGKELTNNYSLNTVDICPVGALTSTDFRFKMRVWFLKRTPSICTESSVGVNTTVWSREGKIYRITPRDNDAVNDSWMADSGREIYKQVEAESRLMRYEVHGNKVSLEDALECAREHCEAAPQVAYVVSARMSLEEHYAFNQLVSAKPGPVYAPSHIGRGDGFLISEDRTPNVRGLLVSGLMATMPVADLTELAEKIRAGEIKTLIVCNEDLAAVGLTEAELKKVHIIYLGTHETATSACAEVVLPTLMAFEKSGSFVNQQFRLQKFSQAIPGPAGIMTDTLLIGRLTHVLSGKAGNAAGVPELWQSMSAQIPVLAGISYASIPAEGLQLEAAAWKHLKFPEGKTLHYNPVSEPSTNA